MKKSADLSARLKVTEALGKDVGRALARMDPADIVALGAEIGDIVEVVGKRRTVCKLMPAYKDERGGARIQLDGLSRTNAGVALDDAVAVQKVAAHPAQRIVLSPTAPGLSDRDLQYIGSRLDGLPVIEGDRIRGTLFGNRSLDFVVRETQPKGPVLIAPSTLLSVGPAQTEARSANPAGRSTFSYEDIGGLKREVQRVREIIELPLRFPEVFVRLGIDAPKGVLLYGPPGCGKTLIARAVAHETDVRFFSISGPEIMQKFYGESEGFLRKLFDDATKQAPSIIFIDEIDSIAPKREGLGGEHQVERRVVAQLLSLMDGLKARGQVIVIAATNIPNAIDPAFTTLHETGHFLDNLGFHTPTAERLYASEGQPEFDGLMRELRQSVAAGRLANEVGADSVLLSSRELFARAYAQYIAQQAADASVLATIRDIRQGNLTDNGLRKNSQ